MENSLGCFNKLGFGFGDYKAPDFSTSVPSTPSFTGSGATSTSTETTKPKFGDTTLGGVVTLLAQNLGGAAQIISALKGNKTITVDGKMHELSDVNTEINKIATAKGQSPNDVVRMMLAQLKEEEKTKKKKTVIYIGVGVGVLALIGGVIYMSNNKKSN